MRRALEYVRATGKYIELYQQPLTRIENGQTATIYAHIFCKLVKDKDGSKKKIILILTELPEQVQCKTFNKLEEQEELLRIALKGGDLGYFDYYPQSGQLYWSDRTKEMFGLPPEAEIDYSIYLKGLHPDGRQGCDEAVQRAITHPGGGYNHEYRAIGFADGKLRWVRSKGKIFLDEAGNAFHFTGVTRDITQQKSSEEKIKASEARYRDIFEGLHRVKKLPCAIMDGSRRKEKKEWAPLFMCCYLWNKKLAL